MITSFTILLMYTRFNHPMENYFLPNLTPIFFIAFIYFHLCALIFICKNFFLFMIVCENLFLFMIICENLFFFVMIFLNPSYLWKSLLIGGHLWESFNTSFDFYSLYENKEAYEYHHLKQIFYHRNMIMIFCWLRIFQFYVFTLNSFHFVSAFLIYQIKCLCIH